MPFARFATVAGALIVLAAVAAPPRLARAQQPPAALPVTVAQPLQKRVQLWDEYSGRFEAVAVVEVRPRVSGFIEQIHFRDGQIVKAGDLLFTIEKRMFEISVESAQAEIARTTAQVELQESEVERATPLAKSGAVTKRDLDQRSANLLVARAQRQAAEAGLKSAQLNLEWTEVRAPIAGRISDRKIDVGNLVTGGTAGATVLTTIVSLDPIHFRFDISEADYMRYVRQFIAGDRKSGREHGHPVRIKLADDRTFSHEGRLDFVDNQLNARSGTLRGRAILANPNQLFTPGLFARMQLFGGEADVLLVPDQAIVSDQARKIVFTIGDGDVVVPRPVQAGALHEGLRIVSSGLDPTSRVVLDGLANPMVRPGAKVTPQPGRIAPPAN